MSATTHSKRCCLLALGITTAVAFLICGCGEKKIPTIAESSKPTPPELPELPDSASSPQQESLALPVRFEHHTGDLDGMSKRCRIRALVVYGHSAFFYDKGRPKGISYEAAEEFQSFPEQKAKNRQAEDPCDFHSSTPGSWYPRLLSLWVTSLQPA
jgi:hypothetical protein